MDLVEFIGVIKKWKWLILPFIIIVVSFIVVSDLVSPTHYKAETTVVAGLSSITMVSDRGIGLMQSGDLFGATYAELVTSQPVLEDSLDRANLNWSVDRLRARVSAESTRNTPVLTITVVDTDPERAKLLANSVSDAFVDYITEVNETSVTEAQEAALEQLPEVESKLAAANSKLPLDTGEIAALQSRRTTILNEYEALLDLQINTSDLRVVNPAGTATVSDVPPLQRAGIALIISLVGGIAIAFIAEAVRKTMQAPDDLLS